MKGKWDDFSSPASQLPVASAWSSQPLRGQMGGLLWRRPLPDLCLKLPIYTAEPVRSAPRQSEGDRRLHRCQKKTLNVCWQPEWTTLPRTPACLLAASQKLPMLCAECPCEGPTPWTPRTPARGHHPWVYSERSHSYRSGKRAKGWINTKKKKHRLTFNTWMSEYLSYLQAPEERLSYWLAGQEQPEVKFNLDRTTVVHATRLSGQSRLTTLLRAAMSNTPAHPTSCPHTNGCQQCGLRKLHKFHFALL